MGSFSRLVEELKGQSIDTRDIDDVAKAIEALKGAGDDFTDILWFGGELCLDTDKDKIVDDLREHVIKLQKAIDRIAISR